MKLCSVILWNEMIVNYILKVNDVRWYFPVIHHPPVTFKQIVKVFLCNVRLLNFNIFLWILQCFNVLQQHIVWKKNAHLSCDILETIATFRRILWTNNFQSFESRNLCSLWYFNDIYCLLWEDWFGQLILVI